MDIAEIRFLEGPNLFLLRPAVKIEVVADESGRSELAGRLAALAGSSATDLASAWGDLVAWSVVLAKQPVAESAVVALDQPDRVALIFEWSHRPFAGAFAEAVRSVVEGTPVEPDRLSATLLDAASRTIDPPEWIRDNERRIRSIAITGTNGKTTTTRLLAHIARTAGLHVGWSSSSGVYVDGEVVEPGDFSGPSGAGQVLGRKGLDLAILETARGGILLKGLGYESNDVSVFTNVSGDHLGLNGVLTVETLARVKAVVCRVTAKDGVAVLNADDTKVMDATADLRAARCLVSQSPSNALVRSHRSEGGATVVRDGETVVARSGDTETFRINVAEMPMCFGGKAAHQVENACGAIGAAIAAGLPTDAIRQGLTSFGSDLEHNPGRLNVIDMGDYTVVLDYAHNESGLERLLTFGRELGDGSGRLIAVIGSAGDRDPRMLAALGRIAAEKSDHVVAKGTERYLRGIARDDLMRLYREGAAEHPRTPYEEVEDEWAAVRRIPELAHRGDVFVLMFQELLAEVPEMLRAAKPG